MILLIGGTSETALVAQALADAGFVVVVSTATDLPLEIGSHPNISRTSGALDSQGIERLAGELRARMIVDCSHPYATAVKANARAAAKALGIPYAQWMRPRVPEYEDWIIVRETHTLAAETACAFGSPVLVTTGAKNLAPYAAEARRTGVELVVRVLPYQNSLVACHDAGIDSESIVTGRGPFSVEENLKVIRRFNIGVVVTKDSGEAGGMPAKIEAARVAGCHLIVIQRPASCDKENFTDVSRLVAAVGKRLAMA